MDPQVMADALRQQEAAAFLAQITGDPVLGQFGTGLQRQVQRRREGLQAAREAQRKFEATRPSGVPGFVLRAGQVEPMPGYEEQRQREHARDMQLAGLRAANRQDQNEWYRRQEWLRQRGTPGQTAEARKTLAFLPELQSQAIALEDIEIPEFTESMANYVRDMPMGESLAPLIERKGMSPEAVAWLETGRQVEQDLMRLASGLAVTGFELQNIKKWSPWASNITNEQRRNRLRNVYNKLGREAGAIQGVVWQDAPESQFRPKVESIPAPPDVDPDQWNLLTPEEQVEWLSES